MTEHDPSVARLTQRPPQAAIDDAVAKLAARFGNLLVTSMAVRQQHGHNLSWTPNQPPDAVVSAQSTADVSDAVKICAARGVPVFRTADRALRMLRLWIAAREA